MNIIPQMKLFEESEFENPRDLESLLGELHRNRQLRTVCGFEPFVRSMDATSYASLNQLYNYVSGIQEQQLLMKNL